MQVGTEPKGIIAAGTALSGVFTGKNWDEKKRVLGKPVRRIYIRFDCVSGDFQTLILPLEMLREMAPDYNWTPFGSGYRILPETAWKLEEAFSRVRS